MMKHGIEKAGHTCQLAAKSIIELGEGTSRLARLVSETKADAWIIYNGTRMILQ